jgi:hypothetical protein
MLPLPFEQLSVHPRSDFPTIGIKADGLKGCLIFAQK